MESRACSFIHAFVSAEDDSDKVVFGQMSEEELLSGIEGLVAPEKNDDY